MLGQGVKKKSKVIPDTRACFFNIILPGGSNTHQLRIPPCFIKHTAKDAFDVATLRGPSGDCWRVKLCKNVNGFYLQDGWQGFLKAHSLGNHEFLLFAYDGKMCFSVRIYDKSGLERVNVSQKHQEDDYVSFLDSEQPMSSKHGPGCGPSKHKQSTGHQESASSSIGMRKQARPKEAPDVSLLHPQPPTSNVRVEGRRPRKDSVGCVYQPQPPSLAHGHGEDLKQFHKPSKLKKARSKEDCSGVQFKMEEISLSDDEETGFRVENGEVVKNSKILKDGRSMPIQRMRSTPKYPKSASTAPTEAKHQVCSRAETFRSRFPHFERCLALFNVEKTFVLNIPTAFARKNFPSVKTKMTLRNSKGESWQVNFHPKQGNSIFCGGWRAFVHGNNLREGDVCIFELVGKTEMQVHIF